VEVALAAFLKNKTNGCTSCRACQKSAEYACVIDDEITPLLAKMVLADVIVMATPLYFFSMSAQIKGVLDRMFSLYKWDNDAGTMNTVLKDKTFVLLASAFEDIGLGTLAEPFALTAQYSRMHFEKMIVANARISGEIRNIPGVREQAVEFGRKIAGR